MKTCPRWCCSLSWSLATLCSYLKEQTKSKTKRHMLLVCNPAGSDFSYSCLCCSLSVLVSTVLFFLLHSAPISALLLVHHHHKILSLPLWLGGIFSYSCFPFLILSSSVFSFSNSISVHHLFSVFFSVPPSAFIIFNFNSFFHSWLYHFLKVKQTNLKTKDVTSQLYPGLILHFISIFPIALITADSMLPPSFITFCSFSHIPFP